MRFPLKVFVTMALAEFESRRPAVRVNRGIFQYQTTTREPEGIRKLLKLLINYAVIGILGSVSPGEPHVLRYL